MLKKIITFSTSYVAIEALQKGIMFFLMSLFTYYMTTEEYGLISSALIIIQFLAVVFSLSLTSSISRYYFKYANSVEKLRNFLGSTFLFMLLVGIVFLFVFLVFGKTIFVKLFPELPFNPYMVWIFMICVLQPFNMAYFALLKAQQKIKLYALLYSCYFGTQFILMSILIIEKGMRHDGYILSILWSNIIFLGVTVFFLVKEFRFVLKKEYIFESFKYAISFLPAELFTIINALIDRFYILALLSLSALGIYQIGIQIGAILILIFRALNYAYLPHFMTIYESENEDYREIYKFADLFVFISVILTGYLSILSPYFIEYALDKAYVESKNIVVYINFTYALNSVYFINVNVLSLTPRLVKLKTLFLIMGGILNLGLNYLLINKYGLIGAAIATFIGFGFTNLLLIYVVERKTTFAFNNFKNFSFIIISFFSLLLISNISAGNILLDVLLMIICFTLASFLLFGSIHRNQFRALIKIKPK